MKPFVVSVTLLASLPLGLSAFAEEGYFAGGPGARASGRAGAVTARADDLTAVSYNPAGLAKVDGTLIQFGNQLSYNAYSFKRATTLDYGHPQNGNPPSVSFATVTNGQPWQALDPLLGVASNLGLKDWGFALSAFAPPGIGREHFPISGGQRYMMVDREAIILTYAASAAWKHDDTFGVGATVEWIHVPRLNYSLVIDATNTAQPANPVSSALDMLASTSGSSLFTLNAIVGAWVRPTPFLEFGVSGQVIPTDIVVHSKLTITPLATQGTVTLTRGQPPKNDNDVTVTLPLPLVARAGARYRHLQENREVFDLEFDVEYSTWSRASAFTVDASGLRANFSGPTIDGQFIDLNRIVIDKQWQNTVGLKLGGDFVAIPDLLSLRAGVSYETAVAKPAYANVDFPGGQQIAGSLGTSLRFGHLELALAYMLRVQPSFSVSERNARVYQQVPGSPCTAPYTDMDYCSQAYLNQPSPAVNAGTYTASSHVVFVDAIYRM